MQRITLSSNLLIIKNQNKVEALRKAVVAIVSNMSSRSNISMHTLLSPKFDKRTGTTGISA